MRSYELIRSYKPGNVSVYTGTGEKMIKAEQVFKKVDFSVETDFKERLRQQLFEQKERARSEQVLREGSVEAGRRKTGGRQLSFDELDLVNAAGSIDMQQESAGRGNPGKDRDRQRKTPWNNTFSGNLFDNDTE